MATEFDYDSPPDVDADTIAAVVADMSGSGLPKLTEEEREQRQLDHWRFLEQCRVRAEQERFERNRAKAEADAVKEAEARRQEAIARSERNRQLQEQQRLDSANQLRDAHLASVHRASLEAQQYRHAAVTSARFAAQRELLDSALSHLSPPPEPPEPTIVVVQDDDGSADFGSRNFDVAKWSKKPRSWW